jgi:hypothetical protein
VSESKVAKLKGTTGDLEAIANAAKSPDDSARLQALADILKHPAA